MNKINVLSLFSGMEVGRQALKELHIGVNKYYSSEVNPYAIKTANKNHDDLIQVGDVTNLNEEFLKQLPKIDLIIGGSPCQGFSIAGKKLNFQDHRSVLFFEYVRILNWIKKYNNPNVQFLLENVKMKDEIANAIDNELGVSRLFINSKDFTGHIRKRYYWTNIHIGEWEEKDIKIKDIIDNDIPYDKDISFFLDRTQYTPTTSRDGIITINPKDNNEKQTWQRGRVYDIEGNCPTICASLFDLNITKDHKYYRKLTINECEKLQGLPQDYTEGVPKGERGKLLGNGWTLDVIKHILKNVKCK